MTRKQFLQLPEYDMNLFIAKLITAIKQNDKCFEHADYVVAMSARDGNYNVKFGNEVCHEGID